MVYIKPDVIFTIYCIRMGTQLVICGSVALDRIMSFSGRYRDLITPDNIDVLSLSPLLDSLKNSPGGIGANITYSLARLGEKPILLSSVGSDAKEYLQDLENAGVDVSHIHMSQLPTASFNVITDSDGNQVGGFYPGAMGDSESVSFKPWQNQDVLAMVSAHDPNAMNRQVAECQANGIRLIYDPGQQVTAPATDLQGGIKAAEVMFVNEYELGILCETTGISLTELKSQVPILVTTLGKDGSVIEGQNMSAPLRVGIATPSQVIDPTGAGDGYRAGFLYGYLRQWDLADCGRLGAVVSSFIVEQQGTQHPLSKQAIMERYHQTFKTEVAL